MVVLVVREREPWRLVQRRAAEAVVWVAELEQQVDILRAEVIAWQGVASQEDLRASTLDHWLAARGWSCRAR